MENIARLLLFAFNELRPAERLSAGASRLTTAAVCSAAAVIALTVGFGCVVTALWLALIPLVGAPGAALCAGGLFLIVAGVFWLLARTNISDNGHDHGHDPLQGVQGLVSELFNGDGMDEIERLFAKHKVPIMLAAVVIGLTLGNGRRR